MPANSQQPQQQQQLEQLIPVELRGGVDTIHDKTALPPKRFSTLQNVRGMYPGFEKRRGQVKQHSTASAELLTKSLYGYSKGGISEVKLLRQLGDGSLEIASNNPPAITTGVFGSQALGAIAGTIPASYSMMRDMLVYSDSGRQHQLFGGNNYPVSAFIVYPSSTVPNMPELGKDYSREVVDGVTTTYGDLSNLGILNKVYVMTMIPSSNLKFTLSQFNGNAAVSSVKYWNGAFTAVSGYVDATLLAGATFGQNGSMSWTAPSDELPSYMFGRSGFWYEITVSAALDAGVWVQECVFDSTWQTLQNVWDGVLVDAVEVLIYDQSASNYLVFDSGAVSFATFDYTTDKIYIAGVSRYAGIYVDVGATPNTAASTIASLKVWDGSVFTAVSGLVDGSDGFRKNGWVTWNRATSPVSQPSQFNDSVYYGYWIEITIGAANVVATTNIGVQTVPYHTLVDFGTKGLVNVAWKNRMGYVFDKFPNTINFTAKDRPMTLNGSDFGIIEAGDGRSYAILCIRKFYNELLVWQEERGVEGGCLTLVEGYSPTTFAKLVLSSRIGILNSKCAAVIEGVSVKTTTVDLLKTVAFWLSHFGVFMTDGKSVILVSQDIQNYFDPTKAECIRRGYEDKMWLAHDSAENVLRLGLVSGGSATVPNIFPVYDIVDGTWSFDVLGQALTTVVEMEAGSGNAMTLQVGGGAGDGFVYVLNSGYDDVAIPITAAVGIEVSGQGRRLQLKREIVRLGSQSQGVLERQLALDGDSDYGLVHYLPMPAATLTGTYRRHSIQSAIKAHHLSLKYLNQDLGDSFKLQDVSLIASLVEDNV